MTEQELLARLSAKINYGHLTDILEEYFHSVGMHDAGRLVAKLLDEYGAMVVSEEL